MTEYLVMEPYHLRYVLPDGVHCWNAVLNGLTYHCSIILRDDPLAPPVKSFDIKIADDGSHEDLLQTAQELAKKSYASLRDLRRYRSMGRS